MYILVMPRFGNLKVGSVFGFYHPETAVSISSFPKKKNKKKIFFVLKIDN